MLDIKYVMFLFEELTYLDMRIASLSVCILNLKINDFHKKELALKICQLKEQRKTTLAELYVIANEVWQMDKPLELLK